MAYKGYKVVAFTPAGRKRTMSILIDNLRRFTDIVDEYQVWMNTDDEQVEDTKWLETLPDTYPWVKLVYRNPDVQKLHPKQMNTGYFYANNTVDENTIYIRFDDDIVYIDDNFFSNLLTFRIENPDYFVVMANIWNNAVTSYIHQQLGNIPAEPKVEEPYCMDPVAWENPKFAETIHQVLIQHINDGSTEKLLFSHADLNDAARFSISCFCFFGRDFAKFDGIVGQRKPGVIRFDEEIWLTEVYPTKENKLNTICGTALVAHYSFMRQRPHLDSTRILETYRALAKQELSDSYYDMLEQPEGQKGTLWGVTLIDDLPVIDLPRLTHSSSISDALKAEMNGYIVRPIRDNYVEIYYEDKLAKTVMSSGENKVSERSIDEALAVLWRSDPRSIVQVDRQEI